MSMPRADDEKPFYCREDLPEHLKDHTFFRNYPTRAEVDAFTVAWIEEAFPNGLGSLKVSSDPAERAENQDAAKAENLQDKAQKFARQLLAEVSTEELVISAAPPKKHKTSDRQNPFNYRNPEYVEERHGPYKDCAEKKFGSRAIELGKVPQFGTFIRSELILISLVKGEPPKFGHVCDGRGLSKADEGQIAKCVFPIIWQAHESSLVEAEKRKLMRDFTPILREPRAELVHDFFSRLTDMKLCQTNVTLRNMFKVLDRVIKECRADLVP